MLEQILVLSAEQVAGARTPGKASGDIRHHGSQPGCVQLADRKVKVKRPRLRHKTEGEVKVPAYEALRQDRGLGQHMLGALLRGVSTREYQEVLPQMAETVGVSRSAISRKAVEASAEQLKQLQERRWENVEILVIYIDGQRFGEHHILSAVGVDAEGKKHILGIESGAQRMPPVSNACSPACAIKACRRTANTCSSSMGPKRCARDRGGVRRRSTGAAVSQSQATQCRRRVAQRAAGQALNLMRAAWKVKTAEEGEKRLDNWRDFWSGITRAPRAACGRG
jgi:Transposase and inactivated derivatives